jgi:YYY domain-containing protein
LRFHDAYTSRSAWSFFGSAGIATIIGGILVFHIFARNYATLLFLLFMLALTGSLLVKQQLITRSPWRAIPSEAYILLCIAYAGLITAGCEIVFVRDFLQGGEYKRMNTIFKFYLPVWYLLAFVAVYALYALWQHSTEWRISFSVLGARYVLGFAAILFIMAAAFPIVSSYSRRQSDFYGRKRLPPTLNGLAFIRESNRDEYEAIQWLNTHVAGTPTILEAVHDDYRYEYARISANTGLPTVLGWPSHADQREHWGQTHPRRRDVIHIYATLDAQHAYELLQKYQVRYVYIGKTERQDFSEEELRKFQEYPNYFREVFRANDTVIYEVR